MSGIARIMLPAAELRRLAASFNETPDALERSVQAQRHLIANASHGLRTPMAAPSDHVEPIELDAVVREALARAQRRAPGLRFEIDVEPTVIVNAPDRVSRAVTNLIDNARKWSPPDGEVQVTLRDGEIVRQAAEAFGGTASAANAPGGGALLRIRFGSAAPARAPVAPVA